MYRKLVIGVLSITAVPSFALANRRYGMAGCGLGSVVMGRSGSQVSAATTNNTFNSQMFGITTGTSNCVPDRKRSADVQQENFMFNNYATLSREMAQGNGTTLAGLAEVLGCSSETKAEFNNFAQENHKQVFAAPGAIAALNTFKESLSKNETLARNCGFVAALPNKETK